MVSFILNVTLFILLLLSIKSNIDYKKILVNKAKRHETEFIFGLPYVILPEKDYMNLRLPPKESKENDS